MKIVNLASGSKANSTFLSFNQTKMLIDVGLNEKNLKQRLEEIGEKLDDICAVCITHEHIDHIRALKSLAKKYEMDFFVEEKLCDSQFLGDVTFKEGKLHKITDKMFPVGDFDVLPVKVSHDAIEPVSYIVCVHGSSSKVGFLTDTGVVFESAKKQFAGVKMIFIESNYDEEMLKNGFYPEIVKKRIAGEQGHLSNKQSIELANFLFDNGAKCFVLSHLSENNNTPEIAYLNYVNNFKNRNLVVDKDVFVRLSYQHKCGNNFTLKEEFDG